MAMIRNIYTDPIDSTNVMDTDHYTQLKNSFNYMQAAQYNLMAEIQQYYDLMEQKMKVQQIPFQEMLKAMNELDEKKALWELSVFGYNINYNNFKKLLNYLYEPPMGSPMIPKYYPNPNMFYSSYYTTLDNSMYSQNMNMNSLYD